MRSVPLKRGKDNFRRISKARIFDGHVVRVSPHVVVVMALSSVLITSLISLLFSYFHHMDLSLVLWTLLPGALLGYFLLVAERSLSHLKEFIFARMGKLITGFLLFFTHIIVYLALSSIVVSYPLEIALAESWNLSGTGGDYSLFSANFFIVLAILSWLRNVRTPPCNSF